MLTNTPTPADIEYRLRDALDVLKTFDLSRVDSKDIGTLAIAIKALNDFREAIDIQLTLRVIEAGIAVPGVSTKPEVKQRIWNEPDTVAELAYAQFGLKAFKLAAPATIEKFGDEGKALVAVASTKPDAGRKIAY